MAATAVGSSLAFAGTASALELPQSLGSNPASPSNQTSPWSFTWAPPVDALPPDIAPIAYYGGVTASTDVPPADLTPIVPGVEIAVPEGARFFMVRAEQSLISSGWASMAIHPDYTAPTMSVSLAPGAPNGDNGWYTSLTINRSCDDGIGTGVADCGPVNWTQDRQLGTVSYTPVDRVGNPGTAAVTPAFRFDATKPQFGTGLPSVPNSGALVAEEPTFEWTPGVDPTSGVDRYELQYEDPESGDWTPLARRDDVGGVGNYSAKRDPALVPQPLPERVNFNWRVVTWDNAGNVRISATRGLRIDSTVPAAPTITGGPTAPTRISSPTFSWTGTEQTYRWELTLAGSETPVRVGGGASTQATITNLPDGDYTFAVSQVTEAGRPSADATRSFKVDTTPPPAPGILIRPPFPAIAAPVFTWETEPGAYSRWTVVGEGGITILPYADTPATSVTLPVLPDGAYSFQVLQVDAAGNVSAPSVEPFTMIAPLTPAPSPSGGGATAASILPRQNAKRLKPKAGKTVPTRAPVLQWKRGPRGTKLYNLQLFKVTPRKGNATPRITKVLSLFPRGLQFRAPKKNLRPGTCYVWRVWPYTGRAFTPKPIGVSNFCVASAKILKKKEAAARAKKVAAARRAAEARRRS
ncbi:MAG: hypothetical protein AB7V62_01635 [Thermoleophilia bacterium]